ncbi:hypothetical protein [Pararhodobacter sp. SW119]|uniref:hypothetical protein n=1 Tax=Pararhodobacter sp. SW119 TaxID=2780075 RepID=UPI001ADF301A|nr:hypothetical protein [Pararhodobacter sp. SW119]
MIVVTDLGAIRLAESVTEMPGLSANERAWIGMLRELGGGVIPPPNLATVQALRLSIRRGQRA